MAKKERGGGGPGIIRKSLGGAISYGAEGALGAVAAVNAFSATGSVENNPLMAAERAIMEAAAHRPLRATDSLIIAGVAALSVFGSNLLEKRATKKAVSRGFAGGQQAVVRMIHERHQQNQIESDASLADELLRMVGIRR